jgi:hypothetical protein
MRVKAIPSLTGGSTLLTFSSETGATVKLVVAFPAHASGPGSPLITAPFWVDPSHPVRFDVTEGLSKLLHTSDGGVGVTDVEIRLSLRGGESQSVYKPRTKPARSECGH